MYLLLLPTLALAGDPTTPDDAIVATVTRFAEAATSRDVAALEATLDAAAVQHVQMGGEWSAMATDTYLTLMRDGRIGGEPVEVEVHGVVRHGAAATVHATRRTPSYTFDDALTLVDKDSNWVIVGASVIVTAAK